MTFEERFHQVKPIFTEAMARYRRAGCPCAFPRFVQIAGIDCTKMGASAKCWDTEVLIGLAKEGFETGPSDRRDEASNERWVCKTCGSVYEYGWSDFSIHVERQKLECTHLRATPVGKAAERPVPLFLGVFGHNVPPESELIPADLETFRRYLLEE